MVSPLMPASIGGDPVAAPDEPREARPRFAELTIETVENGWIVEAVPPGRAGPRQSWVARNLGDLVTVVGAAIALPRQAHDPGDGR